MLVHCASGIASASSSLAGVSEFSCRPLSFATPEASSPICVPASPFLHANVLGAHSAALPPQLPSRRCPEQAQHQRHQCIQLEYTGKARWPASQWCPEADAKQMPSRCQAVETRRCQVAEEMRGPPSGRAQEWRRQPFDEANGPHGAFTSEFRGSEFHFNLRDLTEPAR